MNQKQHKMLVSKGLEHLVQINRQRGLSLVELMIGLVVGLLLILVVTGLYVTSVRSSTFTDSIMAVQENGLYGVSTLKSGFRLAGFPAPDNPTGVVQALDIQNSSATSVVVRAVQSHDCSGRATTATNGLAVNTYTHDVSTKEIRCQGNQANSDVVAVVEDVERFRVLYGIDNDGNDQTCEPNSFVSHANTLDSSQVVAIRFAMLINSPDTILTSNSSESFLLLDESYTTPDDRLLRELFVADALLRNNVSCGGL